jgi:1,2-diacylglycerol 3-alpha-glucosyltransferase
MRVGLFTDSYVPEINGVVNSVRMLQEGLRQQGHEVFVIGPGHPDADVDDHVFRSRAMALPVLRERRLASPVSSKLWRRIKKLDLDIVHTHTEFGVGSFGFRARRQLGIPQVHTYHTVWEEYVHYLPGSKTLDPKFRRIARNQTRRTLRKVNHIIAPTAKTRNLLESYGISIPISVIPTGVDLTRFSRVQEADSARLEALRKHYGIDRFNHTLLMVGRLAPEKSALELLEMTIPYLLAHPDTCLLIAGDGPSLGQMITLASAKEVSSQVIFTGQIAWETIPDVFRIGDVLIGNSHTETQGLTFLEAAASGMPIVTRDNPCFVGILTDGVNASLFTDDSQFLPALEEVFGLDVRRERIEAGLKTAQALSKSAFVEHVEEVYEHVLRDAH